MNKELYVSSTPHETKVALMEDDQLAEVFFERENEYTLAGSIYKGRVTRVLPGMQSAFVDIGLERDAFLYVSDFLELSGDEEEDEEFGEIPAPRGAIDLSKAQPPQEAPPVEARGEMVGVESDEDAETFGEDFSAPAEEQSAEGEGESAAAATARRSPPLAGTPSSPGRSPWSRTRAGRSIGAGARAHRITGARKACTAGSNRVPVPATARPPRDTRRSFFPENPSPSTVTWPSLPQRRNRRAPSKLTTGHHMPVEDFTASETLESPEVVAEEIQEEATHLDQGFAVDEQQTEATSELEHAPEAASGEAHGPPLIPPLEMKSSHRRGRGRLGRSRRARQPDAEAVARLQ